MAVMCHIVSALLEAFLREDSFCNLCKGAFFLLAERAQLLLMEAALVHQNKKELVLMYLLLEQGKSWFFEMPS